MDRTDAVRFLGSIPSISATKGGNRLIMESMIKAAQLRVEIGELSSTALAERWTRQQYNQELKKLREEKDPLKAVRKFMVEDSPYPFISQQEWIDLGEEGRKQVGETSEDELKEIFGAD
jgi:hypothetical protein